MNNALSWARQYILVPDAMYREYVEDLLRMADNRLGEAALPCADCERGPSLDRCRGCYPPLYVLHKPQSSEVGTLEDAKSHLLNAANWIGVDMPEEAIDRAEAALYILRRRMADR